MSDILDNLPEDFKKQIKALQGMYQLIDNTDEIDESLKSKLSELENKLVQKNIVPYIKKLLEPILKEIRVPVSVSVNYKPEQGVKVEAPKTTPFIPNGLQPPPRDDIPPTMRPVASETLLERLIRKYSNQTTKPSVSTTPHASPITRAPATGLCIYLDLKNNVYIQRSSAAQTMADAIKYAMELKGSQTIYDFHMAHLNQFLVDKRENPEYEGNVELLDGYYVNTHSNTQCKKEQLEKISDHFGLGWFVKIVK